MTLYICDHTTCGTLVQQNPSPFRRRPIQPLPLLSPSKQVMAARSLSLLKAICRLDPIVVREGGIIVRVSLASSPTFHPSVVDGKPSFSSLNLHRRFYSSQEVSDAVLRATVKHGVQIGLRNAFKDLKFETGSKSEVKFAMVREAIDAAVVDALKEANLYSDELPVLSEEQRFIKLAVKEGFSEAVKEMEERRSSETPLQKGVFDTAIVGLKLDLELASKTALQELKNGSDEKFESAMESLTEKLNVFMRTYEDMFSVYEEVDVAGGTDTTKEGVESTDQTFSTKDGDEADGTKLTMVVASQQNSKKGRRTKFDLFLEQYRQDTRKTHQVIDGLVGKQADIVDDWYREMAEKFLDETWIRRLKVVKAVVPHVAKIFFLYAFVKMLRQSKVPIWKYPMAARAARLGLWKKIVEIIEEGEKLEKAERLKNGGETAEDSKLFSKVWSIFKSGGTTSGRVEEKPGKDVPKEGKDEDKSGEDEPDD